MDLSLIGVVSGVVITEDDTDPTNLAVMVEWTEPANGGGCTCISHYTIAIDGQVITTTAECGDPQVVIPESEVGGRCIDHSLTITPVLQTGTSEESGRSDPVEFPFGETSFPSPEPVEATSICSTQQWIVTVNWASFPEELMERYPDFNMTIGHGLSADSLEVTAVINNDSSIGLDYDGYQGYMDEVITFCVTFVKDNCTRMDCTTEKLENSISVPPGVYIDGTTAVLSVTYGSCIAEDPEDLELRYTYDPPDGTGYPESPVLFNESVGDLIGVETKVVLSGLKENTQYQYNISLVRRSDGATIGVGVSGEFIVEGVCYCNEETTMSTGATVGITFAITFVVSVTIGAVIASTICYFKRKIKVSISQPQAAVYEDMSGENLRPSTTAAMEMKDNRAYGPVTPRGGPVYEVPGGGGGAVRSSQGILMGENVAYGPVC